MKIALVLMASGAGRRFGANKLLQTVDGLPLVRRVMAACPPELFAPALVVSRYPEILSLAEELGYTPIFNSGADEGISATVRLGTAAAQAAGADGALFAVADQPWITRASVERVMAAFSSHPDTIPALGWQGKKGNPCLFPREFFPELSALTGDTGGGAVIKAHRDRLRLVEAGNPAELLDVDTPADLGHSGGAAP
ncbi:nucleotidyltransferase family protein [uncultured Pseudoflavonifractor sp.]|uniref:nucleotidyltransferase family protein n=1 Tax=uncultured Pseudoflavonifractor sp. TaxID=1221379 RepID=UPI0025E1312B|nr:nucleotidyltransferase family protein [uncultured Pseudoflavonifractor sp.]